MGRQRLKIQHLKPAFGMVGKSAPRGPTARENGLREGSLTLVAQAIRIGNMRKPPHPLVEVAYEARRDLQAGWKLSTDQVIACKRILRDAAQPIKKESATGPARNGQSDPNPAPSGVVQEPTQGGQGSR